MKGRSEDLLHGAEHHVLEVEVERAISYRKGAGNEEGSVCFAVETCSGHILGEA